MRYLLVLFFWTAILNAEEAGFNVKTTPSASEISIKDTLEVALDLTYPEGYEVDLERLRENVLRSSSFYEHPFSITDLKEDHPQENADGTFSQHISMTLQPLRLGQVFLTFYDISFIPKDKKNKIQKVISDIFPIHVLAVEAPLGFQARLAPLLTFSKTFPLELDEENRNLLIENPQLQKKEEQFNEEQMNSKRLPWIEIGSVLLIVLISWIFYRHPHVKPPLTSAQMAQAARQKALADLAKLKSKNLPEKGFFDEFYVELTNLVRAYIEQKYPIPASTSTTPEFLAEVAHNSAFSQETRQLLSQFLMQADKVKFGQYHPSVEECHRAQELALQFIQTQ